jgi:YHS domain-containing protein
VNSRFSIIAASLLIPLTLGPANALAQHSGAAQPAASPTAARDASKYNLKDGLALKGFDPVAYFPEGGGVAKLGDAKFTVAQNGVTYRFSSQANLDDFKKDPARYEPAFGGWCAWALGAADKTVESDPKAFSVENDRLYVFFNAEKRDEWVNGVEGLFPKATASWKRLGAEDESGRLALKTRAVSHYNLDSGVGLHGYDPVSYFAEGGGKPTKGDKKFSVAYRGVTYRFSTEANRKRFAEAPDRFEPAYGGWCAWAMGEKNDKVDPDPTSFKITDGKLYVFYKGILGDTRALWLKDEAGLNSKAIANWKRLSTEG